MSAGESLSLSVELRVDEACRRFEAAWKADRPPRLADYLSGWDGPAAEVLREELERLDAHYRQRAAQPPPGHPARVGEFRILRRVGQGGMGTVYEAVQESLGRHVALKLLPAEALLDPVRLERFRREAKAAARLHHTNIVPVFGTGEADGRHFYAMQFIHGHPLDAVIDGIRRQKNDPLDTSLAPTLSAAADALLSAARTRSYLGTDQPSTLTHYPARDPRPGGGDAPPPAAATLPDVGRAYWGTVARLGAQVADALAYAHAQGVLHRDIKPANLMLDPHGTVWVTDFGLAKSADADDLTHAGDVIGTLRYMAPERFDGAGDHRADVYALGLTLYELLTLRPAFDAPNRAKLVEQALAAAPPKPRAVDPAVPRDLETVVLKAIARDPAARYQSVAGLADDLRRYAEDRPIRARRATRAEQAWRWCRRNPAVASLAAAVVLVLAAGAGVSAGFAVRAEGERKKAVEREEEAKAEHRGAEEQLLQSYLSEARASRYSRRVGQRFKTLETVRKAVGQARELGTVEVYDELRNLAVSALALPDVRLVAEYDAPAMDLFICDPSDPDRHARRTPDGTVVVARFSNGVVEDRLAGGREMCSWAFSPDGRIIYLGDRDGSIGQWAVGSGKAEPLVPVGVDAPATDSDAMTVTRDGRRLCRVWVVPKVGTWAAVYDLPSGRRVFGRLFPSDGIWKGMWPIALSPDGRRLATAEGGYSEGKRRTVTVFDVDTDRAVRQFEHERTVCSVAWMPDSRTLAAALWDQSTVVLHDCDAQTPPRELYDLRGGEPLLRASASGQLLFGRTNWGGHQAYWHPQTGELLFQRPGGSDLSAPLPDGRIVEFERVGGKLRVWAAEPSSVFRTIAPDPAAKPNANSHTPDFHPAGRLAAIGHTGGVSLIDLAGGWPVAQLRLGNTPYARFDPVTGDLLTNGSGGLLRWPVKIDGEAVTVGPPTFLYRFVAADSTFDLSADGRTAVVSRYATAVVLDTAGDLARLPRVVGPFEQARRVNISQDGRWVAGWEHGGGPYKYFDARTGRPATADEYDSGNRADARPYTVRHRPGELTLELLRPGTDEPLVAFEHADPTAAGGPVLSPDSTRLLISSAERFVLHDWDLRELRRQLRDLDPALDWEDPEFPPAPPAPANGKHSTPPLAVRLIGVELATSPAARAEFVRTTAALALLTNPLDADAHYRLGVAALNADRPDEAAARFTFALAVRPDHERAASLRADIALRHGRFADALADADRALAGGSGDVPTRLVRAKALAGLNRPADAAAELTAVLRYHPKDFESLALRADSRRAAGDAAGATADAAASVAAFDEATPIALNNAAWRLVVNPPAGARDPERALRYAVKATEKTPDDATGLNTLGVVQFYAGRYEEAVRTLEKSLAAGRGRYDAYDRYFLAMCHAKLGRTGPAHDEFRLADEWEEKHAGGLTPLERGELKQFRAEAAALLDRR